MFGFQLCIEIILLFNICLLFFFLGSSVLIFRHSDMLWKLGSNKGQANSTLDFLRNTIQLSGAQQHWVAKASVEKLFNLWTSAGHLPEIPRPVLAPPPLEVVQRSTAPLSVQWEHLLIKLKEMEKRQWQKGYKPINGFSKQGYRSLGHFLSGWRKQKSFLIKLLEVALAPLSTSERYSPAPVLYSDCSATQQNGTSTAIRLQ